MGGGKSGGGGQSQYQFQCRFDFCTEFLCGDVAGNEVKDILDKLASPRVSSTHLAVCECSLRLVSSWISILDGLTFGFWGAKAWIRRQRLGRCEEEERGQLVS